MDDDTRFILKRMDIHHASVQKELKFLREKIAELQNFKQKVLGGSIVVSAGITIAVQIIMRKIGG